MQRDAMPRGWRIVHCRGSRTGGNCSHAPRGTAIIAAMTQPHPKPIDSAKLVELAQAVLQADRFPHLATIDGDQPRLRPVSPVKTVGFTVYVANLRMYGKTAQLAANPKVELCYLDDDHNQVRIAGVAEILTDRSELEEIWNANPLMRQYLGNIDNPQLIVYRIRPVLVRYMQEWALEYYNVPLEATNE